ncbi:hypothetical protein bcgnr5375_35400 [Bacillus cereus]
MRIQEVFFSCATIRVHFSLLNVDGFFDPLIDMLQHTVEKGFARPENLSLILSSTNVEDLLKKMKNYNHIIVNKWVK